MAQVQVLLIDHSDAFLHAVSDWLRAHPAMTLVGTARSGAEAIEQVERLNPDLVLAEVTLPDVNGFQMTRRIKSRPSAPVVVLLAFHDSETARREARAAGADHLIAKPDLTDGLLGIVRGLLAVRSGSVASEPSNKPESRTESRRSTKQGPPPDLST